jgi:hypothetical protein
MRNKYRDTRSAKSCSKETAPVAAIALTGITVDRAVLDDVACYREPQILDEHLHDTALDAVGCRAAGGSIAASDTLRPADISCASVSAEIATRAMQASQDCRNMAPLPNRQGSCRTASGAPGEARGERFRHHGSPGG